MKCSKCGAEIDILAKFCTECGESNEELDYINKDKESNDIKPNVFTEKPINDVGVEILAYLPFLIIIPILILKDNKVDANLNTLRFHVNNGIIIFITHVIGYLSIFVLNRIGVIYGGEGAGGLGTFFNLLIIPIFILLCIIYLVPLFGCLKLKKKNVPIFGWIRIINEVEE